MMCILSARLDPDSFFSERLDTDSDPKLWFQEFRGPDPRAAAGQGGHTDPDHGGSAGGAGVLTGVCLGRGDI